MKKILCFGDSNAWGFTPVTGERYPKDVRWPGVAQAILGDGYFIIEETLPGRTTVHDDPYRMLMNGKDALGCALLTWSPLDMVIIALGTNDLKFTTAVGAARGAQTLVRNAKRCDEKYDSFVTVFPAGPKILLASPILVGGNVAGVNPGTLFPDGHAESRLFARHFKRVAAEEGVAFIDSAKYGWPSDKDCVHMDPEAHRAMGEAMAKKIREMLG